MKRRRLVGAALGVVALLALAQSGHASAAGGERANRRSAEEEAGRLLGLLQLPPGASYSAVKPSSTGPLLSLPPEMPAAPKLIDRPAWWLVPGSPDAVLDWVKEHPPAGSRLAGEGSSGQIGGGVTSRFVRFGWAPVPGVLETRSLVVDVVSESGGSSALRADAQVVWTVPRPASERIPNGARVLDVGFSGGKAPPGSFEIAKPKAARAIAAIIDGLPVVQPEGPHSCPRMIANPRTVTLTFRAARSGRAIAEATQAIPPSLCQPMGLSIGGKEQMPLSGGAAVLRALNSVVHFFAGRKRP